MSLRLLHTSDWHLGATLEGVSREPEHELFLTWLRETLAEHRVDVLVVAGDVFDQAQPSAEAQRLYYRFLADLRGSGLRKVVIVGGNHDSPSRLDAPREILHALDVAVVGGLGSDDPVARCLCPVGGRANGSGRRDEVEAMLLAVPFVHEFRLGIRTAGLDETAIRAEFRERFTALYSRLTDAARQRAPGVPVVATGHLAAIGSSREDAPAEIHQIGTLGGLPAEIFDPRLDYVALGHVHRSYRVGGGKAWYPGSPIALTVREGRTPRRVLLVDVEAGEEPVVRGLETPVLREVLEVVGTVDEVAERLRSLAGRGQRPPLVQARVSVDDFTPGLEAKLHSVIDARGSDAPVLVAVRQERRSSAAAGSPESEQERIVSLRELTPEAVFRELWRAERGDGEPDAALLEAFRDLLAEEQEGRRQR